MPRTTASIFPRLCASLAIWAATFFALTSTSATAAPDPAYSSESANLQASDTLDIRHLVLTIDGTSLAEDTFTGTAEYRLQAVSDTVRTLQMWAGDLEVQEIRLSRADTTTPVTSFRQSTGDSLIIELEQPLPTDTTVALSITYRGSSGPGVQIHTSSGGTLEAAWTTGVPKTNRFWFPTFERFADRLSSELKITLPVPLRLVTSGRRVSTSEESSDTETFHYRFNRPHPAHLIGFAARTYENVRSSVRQSDGTSVVLEYLVPPERVGDAQRTFRATPEIMRYLGDQLGVPYPWSTYRQAVIPGIRPAAVQPPMTALLPDSLVIDQRAGQDFPPDFLVAQSAADQWIGALLPPETWADSWIPQGLAAYLAIGFIEQTSGDDAALLALNRLERDYFRAFPPRSTILSPSSWPHPADLLTSEHRAKGARVFHMLQHQLGEEQFQAALQQFVAGADSEDVTTDDLQTTFEDVSDRSLDEFFDQWVFGAGHPTLQISYGYNPSIDSLSVHIEQQQEGRQTPRAFQLELPTTIHGLMGRRDAALAVRERNDIISVHLTGEPRFMEVDPGNVVVDSTHLTQSASAWVRQLHEGQTVLSRLRAARAARSFSDDPSLPIGLKGALNNTSHPAVRAAIIKTMGTLPPSGTISSTIVDASKNSSPPVRQAALTALRQSDNAVQAREIAMQAAQSDTSYRVQATAIRTLAHLGGENTLRVVQSAFVTSSHNEIIRRAAFDALSVLDEPLSKELPLALKWSEPGVPSAVRAAAPAYLAKHLDNSGARQRVGELLGDPAVRVRRATVNALAREGSSRANRLLEQRLEEERHPWIRGAIQRALETHSTAQ